MKTYVRIEDERVAEIILPAVWEADSPAGTDPSFKAGDEIPIDQRYTPEFVSTLVDVTDVRPTPVEGDVYDGTSFSSYVPPARSASEILASNTATRDALLSAAAIAIAPLQDAVDLGEATDQEAVLLKQWKQYRITVNRLDLTAESPVWPSTPVAGS